MPPAADANVGFTLTPEGRTALVRLLDGFATSLPQASALLTDLAGRIVEVARKPPGVNLEGISALSAGVYASTRALALSMGEEDFSLVFEHDADRQVYVRPVAGRSLLVVLLKGVAAADQLDDKLEGQFGKDLAAVIREAREPLQAVPPPRVDPAETPAELGELVRQLGVLMLDAQARRGAGLTPDVHARLLKAREELVQALARKDWAAATPLALAAAGLIRGLA